MKNFEYYSKNIYAYPEKKFLCNCGANIPKTVSVAEKFCSFCAEDIWQLFKKKEEEYKEHKRLFADYNRKLLEEFCYDLFDEFGVSDNPKNDRCLNIARGLSSGSYEDIYYNFEIIVDLIK